MSEDNKVVTASRFEAFRDAMQTVASVEGELETYFAGRLNREQRCTSAW